MLPWALRLNNRRLPYKFTAACTIECVRSSGVTGRAVVCIARYKLRASQDLRLA